MAQTNLEALQEQKRQEAHRATQEAAIRQALRAMDPHADDDLQDYPTILRRLQEAVGRELVKEVSPSG